MLTKLTFSEKKKQYSSLESAVVTLTNGIILENQHH